jgi:hypothetical protein
MITTGTSKDRSPAREKVLVSDLVSYLVFLNIGEHYKNIIITIYTYNIDVLFEIGRPIIYIILGVTIIAIIYYFRKARREPRNKK